MTTKLSTPGEAADILGLPRQTLWHYRNVGRIQSTELDGEVFYSEEQLANADLRTTAARNGAARKAKKDAERAEKATKQPRPTVQEIIARHGGYVRVFPAKATAPISEQEAIERWASQPWRE